MGASNPSAAREGKGLGLRRTYHRLFDPMLLIGARYLPWPEDVPAAPERRQWIESREEWRWAGVRDRLATHQGWQAFRRVTETFPQPWRWRWYWGALHRALGTTWPLDSAHVVRVEGLHRFLGRQVAEKKYSALAEIMAGIERDVDFVEERADHLSTLGIDESRKGHLRIGTSDESRLFKRLIADMDRFLLVNFRVPPHWEPHWRNLIGLIAYSRAPVPKDAREEDLAFLHAVNAAWREALVEGSEPATMHGGKALRAFVLVLRQALTNFRDAIDE